MTGQRVMGTLFVGITKFVIYHKEDVLYDTRLNINTPRVYTKS